MNESTHPLEKRLEIAQALEDRLRALHNRHRSFFGGILITDERLRKVAGTWATSMTQGYTLGFDYSREVLVLSLFPERHGAPFWGTPVGRALAWLGSAADASLRAGEESSADPVPQAGAALALGWTKQRASQLVSERRLIRHPDGGVTRASLSALMRERFPAPGA